MQEEFDIKWLSLREQIILLIIERGICRRHLVHKGFKQVVHKLRRFLEEYDDFIGNKSDTVNESLFNLELMGLIYLDNDLKLKLTDTGKSVVEKIKMRINDDIMKAINGISIADALYYVIK